MLPLLPRELLWQDLPSMDDFFTLDPVNEEYFEAFLSLREDPFIIQADAVKVFNEVYYQVTRMVFERPIPSELDKFVSDIKANLGWNYSAGLVMSICFWFLVNIDKQSRPLNKFFISSIREKFSRSNFWKPFKHCFESNRKGGKHASYDFRPRPVNLSILKTMYLDWREITRDYELSTIEYILTLWDNYDDKREIAKMIEESLSCGVISKRNRTESEQLKRFFERYLDNESVPSPNGFSCIQPCISHGFYQNQAADLSRMVGVLKQKIFEIESENERLNSELNITKSEQNQERSFTLSLIVDYCKKKVEWDDAKSIVTMLYKLLRKNGTDEEYVLVDSIEDVYRQRFSGSTHIDSLESADIHVYSPGNIIGNTITNGKQRKE